MFLPIRWGLGLWASTTRAMGKYHEGYGGVPQKVMAPGEGPYGGVSDGTRTRDILDHNQGLYQLSYAHHAHGAGGSVVRE